MDGFKGKCEEKTAEDTTICGAVKDFDGREARCINGFPSCAEVKSEVTLCSKETLLLEALISSTGNYKSF